MSDAEIQHRFREAMEKPEITRLPYELALNAIEHLINQEFSGDRALPEGGVLVTREGFTNIQDTDLPVQEYNGFTLSPITEGRQFSEDSLNKIKII